MISEQFELIVRSQIRKRFRKIPKKHQRQILERIDELKQNPRPHNSIKLKGSTKGDVPNFRINVCEYRVLYDID